MRRSFTPPITADKLIHRQILIDKIEKLSGRSILYIHAPAGFGKTTTAAMWITEKTKDAAWFALDDYSANPAEFYRGLLLALDAEIDERAFNDAPLEYALNSMLHIKSVPQVTVIDDFHLCGDKNVVQSLPLFLNRLPSDMTFVILSRNPPDPFLIDLKIKGILKQLSATDLQFETEEISELFEKHQLSISEHTAEALQKQTGGWAAALSAILMSHDTDAHSGILNRKSLNNYLKSHVFAEEDDYRIFKMCSVSDILNQELCAAITERSDAWDAILNLSARTGLVTKTDNNNYRFHTLLREFLETEALSDATIDKQKIYHNAAEWYLQNGEHFRALDMAAKSGDIGVVEDYSRSKSKIYGEFSVDLDRYAATVKNNTLSRFPDELLAKSLILSVDRVMTTFYFGELERSFKWFDIVKEHLNKRCAHSEMDILKALFVLLVDPRESVWSVPDMFREAAPLLAAASSLDKSETQKTDALPLLSITLNFPFFHKAQIDYGDIAPRLLEFAARADTYMRPVLGPLFEPLMMLLKAGIHYERCELGAAEKIAEEASQAFVHFPPEIIFSSLSLYAEILRAQGKDIKAVTERIADVIRVNKSEYLRPNFNALLTTSALYSGNESAAREWLNQDMDSILKVYKTYQHITTARAFLVIGEFAKAGELLENLASFTKIYRRSTDYIETLTLLAMCRWQQKQRDVSVATLRKAIDKAKELGIVMPVVKEGVDILPVLEKLIATSGNNDTSFEFSLCLLIKESKMCKGLFRKLREKPVKLSKQQLKVLSFLARNYTYAQIAEEMNISLNTVHAHQKAIYLKLEAGSKMDAVLKARELKLL